MSVNSAPQRSEGLNVILKFKRILGRWGNPPTVLCNAALCRSEFSSCL